MALIVNEIERCNQCPFFETRNQWSSDGWDHMEDWFCKKADRKIQGAVEWHEEKKIAVPDWCPATIDSAIVKILTEEPK